MPLYTSGAPGILSPSEVNELVIQPVARASVAYQVSQLVQINSYSYRFPSLTDDPTAAWTPEGSEIAVDDPTVSELIVTPLKVAGLTVISRELATDSLNPGAQEMVGNAISRDIAKRVDEAFFTSSGPATNAPAGLGALTGVAQVDAGTIVNLDAFSEGQSMAENVGAAISFWVASPSTVLELSTLKTLIGSNQPLLAPDPKMATQRQILGVPLISSPAVDDSTIWGVPQAFSFVVQAQDATLDVDPSPFFTSDRVAVRATLRVAFGHPHPAAVVKISHGGS